MNAKGINKLPWRDFNIYPMQGSSIVIRCRVYNGNELTNTKFFSLNGFNAVTFDPKNILDNMGVNSAVFAWLPEKIVDEFLYNIRKEKVK